IRRMSGDQVELYLKRAVDTVPESIHSIPVVLEEQGRRLRFEEKNDAVSKVLKAVHDSGLEVEKIDVRRPTLEDAFLKLIRKK
ncbi:MAG: DUF4162 domain-containing protein, partial [candidate division Zixibacteria bacterium]|nr:DUF4162 domain-containing protein [candidate division Zixibacteria bacterium]